MSKRIRNRVLVTVAVAVGSLLVFAGFPPSIANMEERIRLGLDLRGGTHLVMEVVTDDAIRAETDLAIERMRELLDEAAVVYRQATRIEDGRFQFIGVDPSRDSQFRDFLNEQLPEWNIASTAGDVPNTYAVQLTAANDNFIRDQAVSQAIQTIRNRIDELGVTEPVIQEHGGPGQYEILVQLPGVDDPGRVKTIMQSTALLELKLVDSGPFGSQQEGLTVYGGSMPPNLELIPSVEEEIALGGEAWYAVERVAAITGRDLKGAFPSRDDRGLPAVSFNLTLDGSQRFGTITGENIGRLLAIILDGRIQSAPSINGRITN
ncbi:uncharacterized protein METZ01_LOCUS325128, partial [marine metagenome]